MPSVSKKQQSFMGAELSRKRAGKQTQTDMSENQLTDFASTSTKNLPIQADKSKPNKAKGMKNQKTQQVEVKNLAKKGKK